LRPLCVAASKPHFFPGLLDFPFVGDILNQSVKHCRPFISEEEVAMPAQPNPVNWFEIPAADLDRAKQFYESVFDTTLAINEMGPLKMAWFPMPEDPAASSGATGSLVEHEMYTPSHQGTLVYFSVQDIDASLTKIEAAGGKTINPKTPIGDYGFTAHFEDSEGNRVALHQQPASC